MKGKEEVSHYNPLLYFYQQNCAILSELLLCLRISTSIQSRDVYVQMSTLTSKNQTVRFVIWCCLPNHDMQWKASYLFCWSPGTEKKAGFAWRKGALGLPLPWKIMCSTSLSDFPSLWLLKVQACCYKHGKVFGFFSSVLDTAVHNLYVNCTSINWAVKRWMASKRNAWASKSRRLFSP